jgi:hypothetical protein
MAGPVVTTLLSPSPASGTWAPTDNVTETTLASGTAASGTFMLLMDTSNQADGDTIRIRVYTSGDGSNSRVEDDFTLGPNAPAYLVFRTAPLPTPDYFKVTALLVAGSTISRSFPWRVINLNGT